MVVTPIDYFRLLTQFCFPPVVPRADLGNYKDIEDIAVCSFQGEGIVDIAAYTFPSYITCSVEASCHGRRTSQ